MLGRAFPVAAKFVDIGVVFGNEKRVVLEAGEKWSEEREELESTDIRGLIGWVCAIFPISAARKGFELVIVVGLLYSLAGMIRLKDERRFARWRRRGQCAFVFGV